MENQSMLRYDKGKKHFMMYNKKKENKKWSKKKKKKKNGFLISIPTWRR